MTINTGRFGTVEVTDEDVVSFEDGILGFPGCERFILINHGATAFRWLQSVEEPGLAFLVVDPVEFFKDYAPFVSDESAQSLALEEETPRLVYTIVTIPRGRPEDMTLNLAGPIVINAETRKGRQFVIDDEGFTIRQRVFTEPVVAEAAA